MIVRLRTPKALLVALVAIGVLALTVPAPAQGPADTAAILLRSTYTLIREQALTSMASPALLRPAVSAIQQALTAAGVTDGPASPVLGGSDTDDLQAVLTYVRAAAQAYAPRPLELFLAPTLRAMVSAIGDPQGTIYTPGEFVRFTEGLRGEGEGLGIQVDLVGSTIVVAELSDGGPAMRAGVRVGDVVVEIDGRPVEGRTPDQVMALLRGQAGTQVTLTTQRGGQLMRTVVVRGRVREIPVRAQLLLPKIGYLRLLEFSEDAHVDIERALTRLTAQGAQALVLDLRDNGGGLVDEAVLIASFFLPRGTVATEEGRGAPLSLLVRTSELRFTGPMVILVNGYSASASEIVAGALQDAGVSLIGVRTYGKGTIQTIFPLPGEWGVRFTTARYRTRNGRPIDGVGLTPDFMVATPSDLIQGPRDIQLGTARFIIARRLEITSHP